MRGTWSVDDGSHGPLLGAGGRYACDPRAGRRQPVPAVLPRVRPLMRIGIVTALAAEARTLPAAGGHIFEHDEFVLALAGPGPAPAAAAAERLRARGCDALISWGVAGALAPTLGAGDLIVASRVIGAQGASADCDPALRQALHQRLATASVMSGALYSSAHAIATASAKAELFRDYDCAAVDMEAIAVAMVASRHGLAFAALRAVVDDARFDLPSATMVGMGERGETRTLATLFQLLMHPWELLDLARLAWCYRSALQALRDAGRRLCH